MKRLLNVLIECFAKATVKHVVNVELPELLDDSLELAFKLWHNSGYPEYLIKERDLKKLEVLRIRAIEVSNHLENAIIQLRTKQ